MNAFLMVESSKIEWGYEITVIDDIDDELCLTDGTLLFVFSSDDVVDRGL
jgi:hypothetical protein